MGTKNNPGSFDCYAAAGEHEPIFTLRATDPLAPILVALWADLREQRYAETNNLNDRTEAKIREARECAEAMTRYLREYSPAPEASMPGRLNTPIPVMSKRAGPIVSGVARELGVDPPAFDRFARDSPLVQRLLSQLGNVAGMRVVLSAAVPPDEIWLTDGKGGGVKAKIE